MGSFQSPSKKRRKYSTDSVHNAPYYLVQTWRSTTATREPGLAAIVALVSHQFDVVLMNVKTPEMEGLEATIVIPV
jgi:CheY-like chemotaxis protein